MIRHFHPLGIAVALILASRPTPVSAADSTDPRIRTVRIPDAARVTKATLGPGDIIHVVSDGPDGPFYTRSADAGRTFKKPIRIVDLEGKPAGLQYTAWDLAVGADGKVHVALGSNAWKLKLPQEEWSFHYASLPPGADRFEPVRNLNRKPSEGFSLATGRDGEVAAAYLSGKLLAMTSRDGGATFTAGSEIDPAWNPCDCCTTSLTFGADGKLALLYREETDNLRDMYVVLRAPGPVGRTTRTRISTTPWNVTACPMTYFSIQPAPDGYVAAWPTKGRIYYARLDAAGQVLPPGEIATAGSNGMRTGVWAATASDRSTLVAWKNEDRLGWQLHDSQGKPVGKPESVPSKGPGAAGVLLSDGRFLLFP